MSRRVWELWAIGVLVLVAAGPVMGQEPGGEGTPAVEGGSAEEGAAPRGPGAAKVICVHKYEPQYVDGDHPESPGAVAGCPETEDSHFAALGDIVAVRVENVLSLIEQGVACNDLRLFMDGTELGGIAPSSCDPPGGYIRFQLVRTAKDRDAWRTLLGSPTGAPRWVPVSIGLSDRRRATRGDDAYLYLVAVPPWEFWTFVAFLAVALVAFFRSRLPNMLRDRQYEVGPGETRPFSLARCQMAFWFFLVISAYLFLWMVLGELDTITQSVLVLLGIGSGTALGASFIDTGKQTEASEARGKLALARRDLRALEARAAGAGAADLRAEEVVLAERVESLERKAAGVKGGSQGFWRDVLSDSDGISLHRFQIVVWTLVLGLIFCVSVYRELAMPAFSATLLALMGVSSGTYLGFKVPERSVEVEEAPRLLLEACGRSAGRGKG